MSRQLNTTTERHNYATCIYLMNFFLNNKKHISKYSLQQICKLIKIYRPTKQHQLIDRAIMTKAKNSGEREGER